MSSLSKANEKAKELEDYIDSDRIQTVAFAIGQPEINFHFRDGIRVQMLFSPNCNFTGEVVIRDRKRMLSSGIRINEDNKPTLVFVFNLFDNQNFIFMCEQYLRDLWVRDDG
jgi:hypothetical protein